MYHNMEEQTEPHSDLLGPSISWTEAKTAADSSNFSNKMLRKHYLIFQLQIDLN